MSLASTTRALGGKLLAAPVAFARLASNQARSPTAGTPPAASTADSFSSADASASPSTTPRTTHFGFQEVPESLKESLVGSVFTSVSPKYDLLNDSMSLGIHRLWKDAFVSSLLPRLPPSLHEPRSADEWKPSFQCLDVAGGTGDVAMRILDRAREKYSNRDIRVEIVDINEGMLHEGRKRVAQTMYYNSEWVSQYQGHSALCLDEIPLCSSPNRIHPRQCPSTARTHSLQLHRPLHNRLRYQELHVLD